MIDGSKIHKSLAGVEVQSPYVNERRSNICTLVGLLLTKLKHYFNDCTDSNVLFGHSK